MTNARSVSSINNTVRCTSLIPQIATQLSGKNIGGRSFSRSGRFFLPGGLKSVACLLECVWTLESFEMAVKVVAFRTLQKIETYNIENNSITKGPSI